MRAAALAAPHNVNLIVGVGGGSSIDCAKAINFVVSNGGSIRDYWGYGKASKPMLPMIAVPTTAGSGSEAQTYAAISDPKTNQDGLCGDGKAAFRAAILDPKLTLSSRRALAASTGYDAHFACHRNAGFDAPHRSFGLFFALGVASAQHQL